MRFLDLTRKAGMPYPKANRDTPKRARPYGWRNGFASMRSATLERDAGGRIACEDRNLDHR
jgi:hypothetical protein